MKADNTVGQKKTRIRRRTYLKGTGYSALLGLAPGVASAEPLGKKISMILVGLKLDGTFEEGCHIPLPDHVIQDGKLVLIDPGESTRQKVENNDILVYGFEEDDKYFELPATMFENKSRKDLTTNVNNGLLPSDKVSAYDPVPFPTVAVQHSRGDEVRVKSGREEILLSPGDQKEIQRAPKKITRPPRSLNGDPVSTRVTPVIVARHTGQLDVAVYEED